MRERDCGAVAAFCALLALAGCGLNPTSGPDSSPEAVAAAVYRHDGPPEITLYTMINNRSGAGAHTSLMINAPSQRVVFDPAGSVRLPGVPEIGDVLYGITPRMQRYYESAHARETYHVRIQRIEVSGAVAEQALRLAQATGTVPGSQCTTATANILRQLPGFDGVRSTLFPNRLADQIATLPGVEERKLFENDDDDKTLAIAQFERELAQSQ